MNKSILALLITVLFFSSCRNTVKNQTTSSDSTKNKDWTMLPFIKVDSANPVLVPGSNTFFDPMWKKQIAWENKDVCVQHSVPRRRERRRHSSVLTSRYFRAGGEAFPMSETR